MKLIRFISGDVRSLKIFLVVTLVLVSVGHLYIGLSSSHPLIGDETAHYYQLVKQSKNLSDFNFGWSVTTSYGKTRIIEGNTHVLGWHYIGAVFYKICPYFITVQLYQLMFFVLLIVASYLTVQNLYHAEEASYNTLLLICTLPVFLLFGIAFYQDLPITAIIVLSFYLLFKEKYWSAILFTGLAFLIKENAVLIVPAFCIIILLQEYKRPLKSIILVGGAIAFVLLCIIGFELLIRHYVKDGHSMLYEYFASVEKNLLKSRLFPSHLLPSHLLPSHLLPSHLFSSAPAPAPTPILAPEQIANAPKIACYPGDMREPINWIIYLGGAIWLALITSLLGLWQRIREKRLEKNSIICLFIGLSYLIPACIIGRHNPDIRYFLPSIPFLIFAIAFWLASWKHYRVFLPFLVLLILLQTTIVMHKIYVLRTLGHDFKEVITVLDKQKKYYDNKHYKIFMYAEKWRFLPYEPDWTIYADVFRYKNDDKQIYNVLKDNEFEFIGIDKSKIASFGTSSIDIRLYPKEFVKCLETSKLFIKLCENDSFIVYELKK